jgi:AmmeMemoRadiSam system protein B
MPSPFPDQPGLLIRDPFRFSDATLIVPPLLVQCLVCFDGQKTALHLCEILVRLTGRIVVTDIADQLFSALAQAGMLEDSTFAALKSEREQQFANATQRSAAHAGNGYPSEKKQLSETLAGYLNGAPAEPDRLIGIAAPHVSPAGGIACYGAAYGALSPDLADRTFVILGTSHYGQPHRFGLTRKPFVTPFGATEPDTPLIDALVAQAGEAAHLEDYCHAIEHSIEFQVIFLQHLYGPHLRILPILCGPLLPPGHAGGPRRPEGIDSVARFIGALGELGAREGRRLFWILGVDMTHVGRRYGDPFAARADAGPLLTVAERDRARIDRIAHADADGFWDLVHEERYDDLKWCGSSPLYTFLRALPGARGQLRRYDQWNIDAESVVSFAAMTFR